MNKPSFADLLDILTSVSLRVSLEKNQSAAKDELKPGSLNNSEPDLPYGALKAPERSSFYEDPGFISKDIHEILIEEKEKIIQELRELRTPRTGRRCSQPLPGSVDNCGGLPPPAKAPGPGFVTQETHDAIVKEKNEDIDRLRERFSKLSDNYKLCKDTILEITELCCIEEHTPLEDVPRLVKEWSLLSPCQPEILHEQLEHHRGEAERYRLLLLDKDADLANHVNVILSIMDFCSIGKDTPLEDVPRRVTEFLDNHGKPASKDDISYDRAAVHNNLLNLAKWVVNKADGHALSWGEVKEVERRIRDIMEKVSAI